LCELERALNLVE